MPSSSRRVFAIAGALALASSLLVGVLFVGVTPVTGPPGRRSAIHDNLFDFEGGGWGHGVGMSQWGAKGRADAGQSAAQILAAYYQNTQLTSQSLGAICESTSQMSTRPRTQ